VWAAYLYLEREGEASCARSVWHVGYRGGSGWLGDAVERVIGVHRGALLEKGGKGEAASWFYSNACSRFGI
jgi:hypothetical protein